MHLFFLEITLDFMFCLIKLFTVIEWHEVYHLQLDPGQFHGRWITIMSSIQFYIWMYKLMNKSHPIAIHRHTKGNGQFLILTPSELAVYCTLQAYIYSCGLRTEYTSWCDVVTVAWDAINLSIVHHHSIPKPAFSSIRGEI